MDSVLSSFQKKDESAVTVKAANIDSSNIREVVNLPDESPEIENPEIQRPAPENVDANSPNFTGHAKPLGPAPTTTGGPKPSGAEPRLSRADIAANNDAAGELILESYDFAMPLIKGAMLDEDPGDFTLTAFKKRKLQKIFSIYFKTLERAVSPAVVFYSTVGLLLVSDFVEIKQLQKKKKAGKSIGKKKRAEATPKPPAPKREDPEVYDTDNEGEGEEVFDDPPQKRDATVKVFPDRHRFEVDRNGFFVYTEGEYTKAKRLLQSERVEQAPEEIRQWWESGLRNKAIKRKLEIYS